MSTKLIMHVSLNDASPADIASLLAAVARIPDPDVRLLVSCHNASQAGQVRRRVREQLEEQGVETDQFRLTNSASSPFFEVVLPAPEGVDDDEIETELAEEESDVPHTPSPVSPTAVVSIPVNGELPEGNFKVRLTTVQKEGRGDKYFVNITMKVLDGKKAGSTIRDRVIVWPVTPRTQHLAQALGLNPDSLGEKIDASINATFWDRRRETVGKNGVSRIGNYYYPLESPPPPHWSGFAR